MNALPVLYPFHEMRMQMKDKSVDFRSSVAKMKAKRPAVYKSGAFYFNMRSTHEKTLRL
jgi:hypothetical protein